MTKQNYGVRIKVRNGRWRGIVSELSMPEAFKFYKEKGKPDAAGIPAYWLAVFKGNKKIAQNWHE